LESQNYFKDVRAETIVEESVPLAANVSVPVPVHFPEPKEKEKEKSDDVLKMMQQQQKILSGILESQIKIIELLQKKIK
jgi:hypothetical protein